MQPNFKKSIQNELKANHYYIPCFNKTGDDFLICSCGKKTYLNPYAVTYLVDEDSYMIQNEREFALKDILSGKRIINHVCKKCKTNFSDKETALRTQNLNTLFLERFFIEEDEKSLTLFRIFGGKLYDEKNKNDKHVYKFYNKIEETYIKINKITRKVYIKNKTDKKHQEIQLENVYVSVMLFFQSQIDTTFSDGFINVHDWIGRLAKLIRDAKNMNIVDELINYMSGTSGFEILSKIAVIFNSIIIYPNLSTIAMTKGNVFLFDLIANCPLPSKKYLKQNKVTAPLKIFNTLVTLKNEKLQKKLDADDRSKLTNVVSSDRYKNLINRIKSENYDLENNHEIIQKDGTKILVRDEISNRSISPLIFNKIQTFQQYEKLIQWLRLVKYDDLLQLINKFDISLLNRAYNLLEFREDLDFERINQYLNLMIDYCLEVFSLENVNQLKNYSPVSNFTFDLFDDCQRMIIELKWDTKTVLYKIKSGKKLNELHDNLLKHRSFLGNNEINQRFIDFSKQFKFLEEYSKDLDIYFKINLLETPEALMKEAVDMHNCAGSYIKRVAGGEYLAFIVYDENPNRNKEEYTKYMMVLEITPLGLEFVGIKSKFNKYGSNRFKEDVKKYLIDKDITFKEVPSIAMNINSSEVAYNGFFENVIKSH